MPGFRSFIYFFVEIPLIHRIAEQRSEPPQLHWIWFELLPGVLVAISACFHAIKKSYIALGFIIIGAGWIFFLTAVISLLGHAFKGILGLALHPDLLL